MTTPDEQAATIARLESDIAQLGQVIEAGVERERAAEKLINDLRAFSAAVAKYREGK